MLDWKSYVREGKKYVKEKPLGAVIALVLILGIFLTGFWQGQRKAASAVPGGRKVLYYVDPMNPAHTSPEPGLAPCGMKMEPVYADGDGQAPPPSLPAGSVKVSPEKQQIIGVRLGLVTKGPYTHVLRTLGKVAVDESRVYRLTAGVSGWIQQTYGNSTGSLVQKDEPLATFYSPEILLAQQSYFFALSSLDRAQAKGTEVPGTVEVPGQIEKTNIQLYEDNLKKLGMSELQIKEIQRTRQVEKDIIIRSPNTSFVIARNVSPGQQFDRSAEWYRMADLSQIWILADLYENEAQFVKAGEKVRVSYSDQNKTFLATVSQVLPAFDPATRTLKVRLEMDNPGYHLRPDMFVDVEFPVNLPPTLTVPAEAVLDSGLKKTVYVDRGNGFFEPRQVKTGWHFGDRVEVTRGLAPGERIVISGNFLLDSESRMKLAAAGIFGEVTKDPVCGFNVDESKAKAAGFQSTFKDQTYYFCSAGCQQHFEKNPERYAEKPGGGQEAASPLMSPAAPQGAATVTPQGPAPVKPQSLQTPLPPPQVPPPAPPHGGGHQQ